MSVSTPDRYRRWFEYEKDAHAKVLASLAGAPGSACATEAFRKAVDLMAHLVEARRLWLFRMGIADQGPTLEELFPHNVAPADLGPRVEAMHAAWTSYLRDLDESELERVFEYWSFEGERFRNCVEDILAQLFGHSSYHRGQIALLLRQAGAEPAVTDFLFWTRERVPEGQS